MKEEWVVCLCDNGKLYRYSNKRRPSGRPVYSQVRKRGKWADVVNIDILNSLWNISENLPCEYDRFRGA